VVLLLPRDRRAVSGATAAQILEALAGVALDPDELRAVLNGCMTPNPIPISGTQYGGGWGAIELQGGATAYVRPLGGTTRLVAGRIGSLTVEYADDLTGLPRRVRLLLTPSGAGSAETDLTIRVSQLELNVSIDAAAFTLELPADTVPLTIEELREAGPLGGSAAGSGGVR
jgi:hypothetical protein